jgi:hypothetical protein
MPSILPANSQPSLDSAPLHDHTQFSVQTNLAPNRTRQQTPSIWIHRYARFERVDCCVLHSLRVAFLRGRPNPTETQKYPRILWHLFAGL